MDDLTKEELKSLTVEQLSKMTQEQLSEVAKLVLNELSDYEIDELPKEVRKMLNIKRDSFWGNKDTWIAIIISSLAMTLVQAIMGK